MWGCCGWKGRRQYRLYSHSWPFVSVAVEPSTTWCRPLDVILSFCIRHHSACRRKRTSPSSRCERQSVSLWKQRIIIGIQGGKVTAILTIHIEHHYFIARRCEIGVARHTDQSSVQMLSADIRVWQMVHSDTIWPGFIGLIDHRIVQIPGNIRSRSSCIKKVKNWFRILLQWRHYETARLHENNLQKKITYSWKWKFKFWNYEDRDWISFQMEDSLALGLQNWYRLKNSLSVNGKISIFHEAKSFP